MTSFRIFRRARTSNRNAMQDAIGPICASRQFERLGLSRHMRADIGLDCGCADRSRPLRNLF